jgi:hypothetical protein
MIKSNRMIMGRKTVIALINIAVGLLTAYSFLVSDRETKISATQSSIACEIIKLHLEHSSRQHPIADIVYQNKEYSTSIRISDNLQIGFNDSTFFYDDLLDRVFCRNSGIERGKYLVLIIFFLSFLLWLEPNTDTNKKRNKHSLSANCKSAKTND